MLFATLEVQYIGKNVPEVLSIWPRVIVRTKGPVFPNEDQPKLANPIFNSLYRIVGKGSKMSKILIKIIKPTFAMMVLVIRVHNNIV